MSSAELVKMFTTTTAVVVVEPLDIDLSGGLATQGKRLTIDASVCG
jgi:hypothetical protein